MVRRSAAAVSKWETCAKLSDITLLPPLAARSACPWTHFDFRRDPARARSTAISSRLHQVLTTRALTRACGRSRRYCANTRTAARSSCSQACCIIYIAAALNRAEDTEQRRPILGRASPLFEQGNSNPRNRKQVSAPLRISMLTMLGRYEGQGADRLPPKAGHRFG